MNLFEKNRYGKSLTIITDTGILSVYFISTISHTEPLGSLSASGSDKSKSSPVIAIRFNAASSCVEDVIGAASDAVGALADDDGGDGSADDGLSTVGPQTQQQHQPPSLSSNNVSGCDSGTY